MCVQWWRYTILTCCLRLYLFEDYLLLLFKTKRTVDWKALQEIDHTVHGKFPIWHCCKRSLCTISGTVQSLTKNQLYILAYNPISLKWYVPISVVINNSVFFNRLRMNIYHMPNSSLVPRPPHSFCRLQYEKRGRLGISYHVNDVEGRERVERL